MKRLLEVAFVIALAYLTAFYTSDVQHERELLDFDFDFDFSEFFADDYGYEFDENADIATIMNDGKYYFGAADYYLALEYFQRAAEIDTIGSEATYYIAKSYVALQDYYKAEEYFRETLTKDSVYFSEAYVGLGKIALNSSKFDTALVYFSKAIEIQPDNDNAYYERAENYLNLADTVSALKDFEYAVYLNPNSYSSLFKLANIAYAKKGYDKSIEFYSKCLLLEGANFYSCYFNRALSYFYSKKYEEAIADYKAAFQIKNTDPYVHYNIAISYDYLNDTINAVENYELFTISTSNYDSFYDYSMKRVKELKN